MATVTKNMFRCHGNAMATVNKNVFFNREKAFREKVEKLKRASDPQNFQKEENLKSSTSLENFMNLQAEMEVTHEKAVLIPQLQGEIQTLKEVDCTPGSRAAPTPCWAGTGPGRRSCLRRRLGAGLTLEPLLRSFTNVTVPGNFHF